MDDVYETEQCLVNEVQAHSAWYRMDDCYEGVEHQCDFSGGFCDGYRATADRGDHCLPMMPPRKYWKHCYENCEGRQKIDAWYEGYAHGMLAANQDGIYHYRQIPYYGPRNYRQTSGAAHVITVEESGEIENVPGPLPLNELPVDRTYQPQPAPPATGHSIPVPSPEHDSPAGLPLVPIPEVRFVAPPRQEVQQTFQPASFEQRR